MDTYALQVLLHFQSQSSDDARFEAFLDEVRVVAERHGVTLDEHQSMRLPGTAYSIKPCERCGHLTVDRDDVKGDIENVLPDFWFFVRRGAVSQRAAMCDLCGPSQRAT
jgi:hypothetical protein